MKGDRLEIKSKYILNDRIGNIVLDDFRVKVVPLLQSHRILKTVRNVFNHGNSNYRVSMINLKRFITNYIKDLKRLEE